MDFEKMNSENSSNNIKERILIMEVCRLCLQKKDEMTSFSQENSDLFMVVLGIELTANDTLYNSMCLECKEQLQAYYEFKKKIENNFKIGKKLIQDYFNTALNNPLVEILEEKSNFTDLEILSNQEKCNNKIMIQNGVEKEEMNFETGDVVYMTCQSYSNMEENLSICAICEKIFLSMNALKEHIKNHNFTKKTKKIQSGDRKSSYFQCPFCAKRYKSLEYLNQHKKLHQCDPLLCTLCGKICRTKRSLRSHMDFTHLREKRFKCPECNEAFIAKNQLENHKRKHTGEKRKITVLCTLCETGCANKSELKVHMRVHTGEKPYQCDLCDISFMTKGNLTTHRRTHTGEKPFQCSFCDKSFRVSSSLKVHKRVHTGERPYSCVHCQKSFSKKYNLSIHMKVHNNYKTFYQY